MRSHLTHRVFRAILENRPYPHPRCHKHLTSVASSGTRRCYPQTIQRRSFFGFPVIPQSSTKQSDSPTQEQPIESTAQPMIELVLALEQRARPPAPFLLTLSFMRYVHQRLQEPGVLTQSQLRFLLQTFEHLATRNPYSKDTSSVQEFLTIPNMEDTLDLLSQSQWDLEAQDLVSKLARLVFRQICLELEKFETPSAAPSLAALESFIKVLSFSGSPSEALSVIDTYWDSTLREAGRSPWIDLVHGFVKDDKVEAVPHILSRMEQYGVTLDQGSQEKMIMTLAERNNVEAIKSIYEAQLAENLQPTIKTTVAAVNVAVRNSMISWADKIVDALPQQPTAETRDIFLLLAVAKSDKIDHVYNMIEETVASNSEVDSTVDISTINLLMGYLISMERFDEVDGLASMAAGLGLRPNTQTYMLRVDSRVQSGNIDSAIDLFRKSEPELISEDMDTALLNKVLRHMCYVDHDKMDYDVILSFVDRLFEAKGRFEAETLAALCQTLLYRQDLEAVSDFLRPLIDSYNMQELSQIRKGFMRYVTDMTEPVESTWEVYELMNLAFPSTPVQLRTDIMNAFFKRGRSDLASLVFGHMRQRGAGDRRPTSDTYAQCLYGIAAAADEKSLHLIHNMLKLDLEVALSVDILNALMLAYTACEKPDKAMDFFREILHSEEGPSETTLMIFFRTCETHHNGAEEATKMMEKLISLDLHIDITIYTAYIGALAGHCELELAAQAIRIMESSIGIPPTSYTYVLHFTS